jgi:hypothetical protein
MSKLGVRQFHKFMRGPFRESIRRAYRSHRIFCEADLQSYAWHAIRRFLRRNEEAPGKFRVLNKPFMRACQGTYPDLVVFRGRKPWAVIELKEGKSLPELRASTERKKLLDARRALGLEPNAATSFTSPGMAANARCRARRLREHIIFSKFRSS